MSKFFGFVKGKISGMRKAIKSINKVKGRPVSKNGHLSGSNKTDNGKHRNKAA